MEGGLKEGLKHRESGAAGRFIGPRGLEQLHKYTYRGEDHSLLSRYVLQPFWSRVVLLCPLWLAPNTVTLLGFLCVVLSYALSWTLTPGLTEPLPSWAAFLYALLLFMYQTLDAIDGKQARRTGSSSPLGELFDHGCDALVSTMEVLPFASALRLGPQRALFVWICASSTFFMATWENFHTHILRLPIVNGPTEGLAFFYIIFLSISITGPEPWHTPIPVPASIAPWLPGVKEVPLVDILLVAFLILTVVPTVTSSIMAAQQPSPPPAISLEGPARNGARGSDSKGQAAQISKQGAPIEGKGVPLLQSQPGKVALALPYWVLTACMYAGALGSPSGFASQHPHWFFLPVCFSLGLMAGHLVLAHVTGEAENLIGSMWRPLLLQPLVLANLALALGGLPHLPERWLFAALLLHTGFSYARFVLGVINEICAELQIWCLRLHRPKAG